MFSYPRNLMHTQMKKHHTGFFLNVVLKETLLGGNSKKTFSRFFLRFYQTATSPLWLVERLRDFKADQARKFKQSIKILEKHLCTHEHKYFENSNLRIRIWFKGGSPVWVSRLEILLERNPFSIISIESKIASIEPFFIPPLSAVKSIRISLCISTCRFQHLLLFTIAFLKQL